MAPFLCPFAFHIVNSAEREPITCTDGQTFVGVSIVYKNLTASVKILSLTKVEETIFDKLKNKLTALFNNNLFAKRKYLPNMELIYDNNQNRFKDFKTTSKVDAKKRMKVLLMRERKVTRNVNI